VEARRSNQLGVFYVTHRVIAIESANNLQARQRPASDDQYHREGRRKELAPSANREPDLSSCLPPSVTTRTGVPDRLISFTIVSASSRAMSEAERRLSPTIQPLPTRRRRRYRAIALRASSFTRDNDFGGLLCMDRPFLLTIDL
jgi:hypothetical protein